MISTKWVQGVNLEEVFKIRNTVLADELNCSSDVIHDEYDSFAKNVLVFEGETPVGTGRLLFKEGKYFIDKVCVLKEFRKNSYGELIIRMLVRKAVDIGAEDTYCSIDASHKKLLQKIGFVELSNDENNLLMVKHGDVGGHCC